MPIVIGDEVIDAVKLGSADVSKVMLGSSQVWPDIVYPYIIENVNLTDATIPGLSTGVWVTLIGGGGSGGTGNGNIGFRGTEGGSGGGGGGTIPRVFIPIEDLQGATTFSLVRGSGGAPASGQRANGNPGTASIFACGPVTLTAGGGGAGVYDGAGGTGGAATAVGIGYAAPAIGGNGGASAGTGGTGSPGQDDGWGGTGGGGGSGADGTVGSTNNPQGVQGKGSKGGNTQWETGGAGSSTGNGSPSPAAVAGRPGAGGGGGAGGAGNAGGAGLGYGSGGGASGANAVSGAGGPGYVKVEFVRVTAKDRTDVYPNIGTFTWTPPSWIAAGDIIDVILLAGGAGGEVSTLLGDGKGGQAAVFTTATLMVGTDIAAGTHITVTVGSGGGSGNGSGTATTASASGWSGASSAGAASTIASSAGQAVAAVTVNGITYYGGPSVPKPAVGHDGPDAVRGAGGPAGGTCGILRPNKGGAGGVGVAYIRAYRP